MALETTTRTELPRMTEEEFEAWCDEDTRAEFVDGKVILMAPVAVEHFRPTNFLVALLGIYLQYRAAGEVIGPDYMVRLRSGLRRVPDLAYLAPEHTDRLKRTVLEGAPDAVWEIVSADSEERDWRDKFPEYEAHGVREYWILNPYVPSVHLFRLDEAGKYARVELFEGKLLSEVIPGFCLRPEWLWQHPKPLLLDCLAEMGVTP